MLHLVDWSPPLFRQPVLCPFAKNISGALSTYLVLYESSIVMGYSEEDKQRIGKYVKEEDRPVLVTILERQCVVVTISQRRSRLHPCTALPYRVPASDTDYPTRYSARHGCSDFESRPRSLPESHSGCCASISCQCVWREVPSERPRHQPRHHRVPPSDKTFGFLL